MGPSDPSVPGRRCAWGFGIAGLLIPLFVEGLWWLGWLERMIPLDMLDWVIVVWPWSRLLVHAEEASAPWGLLILILTLILNVLLYAAVGTLVGACLGWTRKTSGQA